MKSRFLLFLCSLFVLVTNGQIGIGTTSPNSTLDVRGSSSNPITTFSTSITAGSSDNMFLFTGTSAATLTLPTAVGITGREYWIKNISSNSSVLTIATTSAQTIDGISTWPLTQTNKAIRVVSNGTNWYAATESLPGSTGTPWVLGGNNVSSVQNVGTTSNYDLPFITNNTERMRLTSTGLGIGITNPVEKLEVAGNVRISGGNKRIVFSNILSDPDAAIELRATALTEQQEMLFYVGNDNNNGYGPDRIRMVGEEFRFQSFNNSTNSTLANAESETTVNTRLYINAAGNTAIGSTTINSSYPEQLLVDAGASGNTNYQNVIVGKGNTNSYAQLNIQNSNAGTGASSDVVATADNGNETTNYVDMGINSSTNNSGVMGGANDSYLYNIGQNFLIGNGTASKSLIFMTGGTTQSTNERMRIDGSGNVGIGVISPSYKLHISGTNPLFLNGVQTGANTDSILTIINGVVKKLHPSALAPSSNSWSILGNASTSPSTNFIGTTDAQALVIKENNTQVGRFDANSIAFGTSATINNSTHSYAFGSSANVGFNKTSGYAIGTSAAVNADSSFSIGVNAVTNGSNSLAIGNSAAANNANSVAIGKSAVTAYSISDALAIGTNATANSSNSIAIGSNSTLANKTVTNAASSIAIGNSASSNSTNAVVIGTGASTGFNLTNPVAIGVNTLVNGNNAVAIGNGASISYIANATALGAGASVSSTGTNSTAIGYNASATLTNEIILGDRSNTSLSVGIGTESFSSTNREKILVDAGASGNTNYQNVIVGKGNTNSYAQLNIQNSNAGTGASSDVVATADNGNETTNYVDMGINSSTNNSGVMGGANDSYLYNIGQNFLIGAGTASKSLIFMTGGTTQSTNERMRINGSGNMGIANTSPSEKLDITGNLKFSGALMPAGAAGTAGNFLVSTGSGTAPTWFDASGYAWIINGNNVSSTKTMGTTSNYDLPFITNNTEKMRLNTSGSLGIGTSTFNGTYPERLIVDGGATGNTNYQNVIVGKGNTNSYAQLNIQNTNAGTGASSDVVATADNGNETINYIDMGINSSGNTAAFFGGANDAYLYTASQNLLLGTAAASKSIAFLTGGGTQSTNERMRIDGSGNVGIGTNAPSAKFEVSGTGGTTFSRITSTANTDRSIFHVYNSATNGGSIDLRGYGASYSETLFGNSMSGSAAILAINSASAPLVMGTFNSGDIVLGTNNNERMRILSGGNIGIGTNTAAYKLTVAGIVAPSADNSFSLGGSTSNRWSVVYATNGTIQTSDRRLKTNIKNLNYGLKEVLALQPVSYNWKEKPTTDNKIGLIAQDVKKIIPEVVTGDEAKEKLGMNYAELVPVLINAIKEQQKQIDELSKKISILEKK